MKNRVSVIEVLILGSFTVFGVVASIANQNPLEMIRYLAMGVGAWCIFLGLRELNRGAR